jgi:hypothetical protein
MNENTLLELHRSLIDLDNEYKTRTDDYKKYQESYATMKKKIESKINMKKHDININMFENGLSLLYLDFPIKRDTYSDKRKYLMIYSSLIEDAKKDLATGAKHLSHEYIGQKYYSGYDQRCDCKYGYGPSHGSIYQRIGLRNPSKELSEYDIECCLYLLENIEVALENLNN